MKARADAVWWENGGKAGVKSEQFLGSGPSDAGQQVEGSDQQPYWRQSNPLPPDDSANHDLF